LFYSLRSLNRKVERRNVGTVSSSATGVQAQAGHPEARLLVVEDEPTILELLSGSLRFAGVRRPDRG